MVNSQGQQVITVNSQGQQVALSTGGGQVVQMTSQGQPMVQVNAQGQQVMQVNQQGQQVVQVNPQGQQMVQVNQQGQIVKQISPSNVVTLNQQGQVVQQRIVNSTGQIVAQGVVQGGTVMSQGMAPRAPVVVQAGQPRQLVQRLVPGSGGQQQVVVAQGSQQQQANYQVGSAIASPRPNPSSDQPKSPILKDLLKHRAPQPDTTVSQGPRYPLCFVSKTPACYIRNSISIAGDTISPLFSIFLSLIFIVSIKICIASSANGFSETKCGVFGGGSCMRGPSPRPTNFPPQTLTPKPTLPSHNSFRRWLQ